MPLLAGGGENERIEALMNAGQTTWAGAPVAARPRFVQNANMRPPPPQYVCHRCQGQGHWISNCPTNGDPKFDFKRIKKVGYSGGFDALFFNASLPRRRESRGPFSKLSRRAI